MRQVTRVIWVAATLAALRFGWIWLERDAHAPSEGSRLNQIAKPLSPQTETSSAVEILHFYARSSETTDGESNLVCYGVRNARSVRIEPAVENLSPSLNRCFFIEPHQDTRYRLIAEGDDDRQASAWFEVHVKPAPPEIRLFAVSERQIVRGESVTLCYGVAHASEVRLEPDGWRLPPVAQNCARFYPKASGSFTLVAAGAGGRAERKRFSVNVK